LGMNCDHVLKWNAKSYEIFAFLKFYIY
jgi:hypothetical protein